MKGGHCIYLAYSEISFWVTLQLKLPNEGERNKNHIPQELYAAQCNDEVSVGIK